ncbi:hypothetical protein GCM10027073_60930 [Streptomyces chlorus]
MVDGRGGPVRTVAEHGALTGRAAARGPGPPGPSPHRRLPGRRSPAGGQGQGLPAGSGRRQPTVSVRLGRAGAGAFGRKAEEGADAMGPDPGAGPDISRAVTTWGTVE